MTWLGVFSGAVCGALLIVAVLATGSTFNQRCRRAFPDEAGRAELCIYNLSHGYRP